MVRRLLITLLVAGVAGALAAAYVWQALNRPVALPEEGVLVAIPKGASFASVARRLERAGVIEHPAILTAWVRLRGLDRQVPSGEMHLHGVLSPLAALARLQSPARMLHRVTIPEGKTAEQVAAALEEAGFGGRDVFLQAMADPAFLAQHDLPATGTEGFLFPDTYLFEWAAEPAAILGRMIERFRQESASLAAERTAIGMSELDMVTLASVIEKEAARSEERAMISGVFHNRLRLGMPLQADPTVLYARPAAASGSLTRADLARPSPYNTYLRRGLPPGPIANPGRAALEAAVAPEKTTALYFVARNDGSHEFSSSLAEHNRAVRRYQRAGRD
jgi:UPF0755 protein